ncbi:DNA polymerase III subunit epsilon [Lamprobacter modestohalophilus]|uniref:DNA-directed DNA polymerase n=1 Tax=Lamprobacter modestohalophilus TaxID=1064514 RepID=A0A9X0WD20_9GAMM|nr:3'-5' exonuclease [Lamprobacter modestohalophilus]MBK1621214.1 DNA polymerase III subunit epsilon [Lamprobacter modestohalophilus]
MDSIVVIDFETTGLSPNQGDRATEIAAVLIRDGQIVDRYQSLMNAGVRIPSYVEALTGISNAMLRKAPPIDRVMGEVSDFVADYPLVAHNASFDRKFWDAELDRIRVKRKQDFICSMLLARRLLPQAPNHQLGTLIALAGLPVTGRYHRALADAEMTANLTLYLEQELMRRFSLPGINHALLGKIQKTPKAQLKQCVERFRHLCVE